MKKPKEPVMKNSTNKRNIQEESRVVGKKLMLLLANEIDEDDEEACSIIFNSILGLLSYNISHRVHKSQHKQFLLEFNKMIVEVLNICNAGEKDEP